jgi:hypothetical protein
VFYVCDHSYGDCFKKQFFLQIVNICHDSFEPTEPFLSENFSDKFGTFSIRLKLIP